MTIRNKPEVDPQLRTTLVRELDKTLYHTSRLRLFTELTAIIQENSLRHGNTQKCLSFRGRVYQSADHSRVGLPSPMNLIHPMLRDRLKAYDRNVVALDNEKELSLGYVKRVLFETDRAEDLYRLLPETLHGILRKFDRYFLAGEGKFSQAEVTAFLTENDPYIRAMKSRMTYNLLEVT